jgi:hypothetical protein
VICSGRSPGLGGVVLSGSDIPIGWVGVTDVAGVVVDAVTDPIAAGVTIDIDPVAVMVRLEALGNPGGSIGTHGSALASSDWGGETHRRVGWPAQP